LGMPTILTILMADSLVQWIDQVISSFGYGGVVTLMLLENLFPPIPSEAILPLVGFLVNRGDLAGIPALIAATLGSLVGALVLYALGRWGGRPLVLRYRRVLRVTEAELDRADGWFDRYGGWIVLFGRMVPLARSVVSIPAGMSEMPVWRFALLTALGSAVWNALLIGAGWFLGENWLRVTGFIGSISDIVLVIVVVGVVSLGVWWWRRPRKA
jgi:membrane protein DedA with SNARE-associated domain